MGRTRELYMEAQEALIAEDMERTGCDWLKAYERSGHAAWIRMSEDAADRADHYRDIARDGDQGSAG